MKICKDLFKNSIVILPVLMILVISGCNKKPEYIPGAGIQGYKAPIAKILFSPVAYDGATVAIEGFVRDYKEEIDGETAEESGAVEADDIKTTFKLTDLNGNYINILMPGQWEVENNNYLIVGGIYRKNGNELEAQQFEKVYFEDKDEKGIDKEVEKRDEW
jgi:hypothetical protein